MFPKVNSFFFDKLLDRVIFLVWLFWLAFGLVIIFQHLNLLNSDLAGHLASGQSFKNGLYHQFSDSFFLGYVHGLFYPPLEDLILGFLYSFPGFKVTTAFTFYVACLWVANCILIFRISIVISSSKFTRGIVLLGFCYLQAIAKDALAFQGLSLFDIWSTGLTSQFLGWIFTCGLLLQILKKNLGFCAQFFLLFAILSHIVMGIVCLLLWGLTIVSLYSYRQAFIRLAPVLLLSAFYWLPLIAHLEYSAPAQIYGEQYWLLFYVCLFGFIFADRQSQSRIFLLTALFLTATFTIGYYLTKAGIPMPKFHYYRFAMPAIILCWIGLWLQLKTKFFIDKNRSLIFCALLIAVAVWVGFLTKFHVYNFKWNSLKPVNVDFSEIGAPAPGYGRTLVLENRRSSDFGLESLIYADDIESKSVKGLYWESSINNTYLSSFLATLLEPPMVLDYRYHYGYDCDIQDCLLEHLFSEYNINRLVIHPERPCPFSSSLRQSCYKKLIHDKRTENFLLQYSGKIKLNNTNFNVYNIIRDASVAHIEINNRAVEELDLKRIRTFKSKFNPFHMEAIDTIFKACKEKGGLYPIFIKSEVLEEMRKYAPVNNAEDSNLSWQLNKIENGKFSIEAPSDRNRWFKIKLNYFPGLKLFDSNGQELPIFQGYPHILAYGRGQMILQYQPPYSIKIGFYLSLLSALVLLLSYCLKARRKRNHSANVRGINN